ncbi:hypothetical protein BJX99DRAFT_235859 [Aspergillus californicus]
MSPPIVVIVGALGAQGSSVLSALLASNDPYKIRALTSNANSPEAIRLASTSPDIEFVQTNLASPLSLLEAFTGATVIFANTVFRPDIFMAQGANAAEALEVSHGLNIVQAASKVSTLQHLVWSTLPDAATVSKGKFDIPHFQSKIPADKYLLDPVNGLAGKTTFLRVGMYASNLVRDPYRPAFQSAGKYVMTLPCSPSTVIPFIGDETANVGIIVEAILRQPEKTLGRYVLGVAEYLTVAEWAAALSTAAEVEVEYAEATLEAYESRWGAIGTEIGLMMKYIEEFGGDSYTADVDSSFIVTPEDLGVQALHSTVEGLRKADWRVVLASA